ELSQKQARFKKTPGGSPLVRPGRQTMSKSSRSSAALPLAPTMRFTASPSLNRIIVGIDTTWKSRAVAGLASTSSLATVREPAFSPAISSRTGATILHGPHQVAQKSTRTGVLLDKTSSENESSVTFTVLLVFSVPVIAVLQSGRCHQWKPLWRRRFR